jgi:3-oxoacyl-[acyl-carrier-protein] synthase III
MTYPSESLLVPISTYLLWRKKSNLALKASQNALDNAGLKASSIDLIITVAQLFFKTLPILFDDI